MKIYFIRHGETEWNKKRKLQGQSDIPLNEYGKELAKVTEEGLRDIDFDIVYTSPLLRAKETAEILKGDRDIKIIEDKRLLELGFGVGEGKGIDQIRKQPDIKLYNFLCKPEAYIPPRGGESFQDLHKRCKTFIDQVILPAEEKYNHILVVGHGALIRGMIGCIEDVPLEEFWRKTHKNCSATIMECKDGKIEILEEGKIYYEEETPATW